MDLLAMLKATARLRFASELVFPPEGHMRGIYPDARDQPLPLRYARRAWIRFVDRRKCALGSQ